MPPFFYVVYSYVTSTRIKEENIDIQLRAIDSSSIVVTMDMDGIVKSVNNNFCKSTGYNASAVKGMPHSRLVPKDYAESMEYAHFWRRLASGETISGEFERVDKNGNQIWVFGHYTPVKGRDGKYSKVMKIATDVTSQHESEDLVNQKNSYLEHAAKILRHDMHSGINTYMPRGLTSLKRRITDEDIKSLKIQAPLKMLEEGLRHTQKVYLGVKEFTNLVKEDAQLDKEMCNLTEILQEYLKATSYIKQVKIGLLPSISVNEPLFCTAIDNLIRNGLKYNDSSTKFVSIYMQDNNHLCVEDNGRGMSQQDFVEYSKPYTRKKGQSEQGSGLGLNICLAILKEHGFTIRADKKEHGTKLLIKIKQ
jgi:PAS domain S-box-containing protein